MTGADPDFSGVARDSLLNASRQLWQLVLGVLISVLLARGLGADGRGLLALSLLVPSILVTVMSMGVGPATVYGVSRGGQDIQEIVRNNTALSVWLGLVSFGIGLAIILAAGDRLLPGVPTAYLVISLALVPINLQINYLTAVHQGLQDFARLNLAQVVGQLVLLVCVVALVWLRPGGVPGAIASQIIAQCATMITALVLLGSQVELRRSLTVAVSRDYLRSTLGYGARAHLANVVGFLNYRADMFLLNMLAGPGVVGVYTIAVSLAERLWIASTSISAVVFPKIAALEGAESARRRLTPVVARHMLWGNLVMAAGAALAAGWLVSVLYSAEFDDSAVALRLLLPGIALLGTARVLYSDLAGRGRPGINSVIASLALLVNIGLNLVLIPRNAIVGVSVATTVSYSLLAALTAVAYVRIAGAPWRELVVPTSADAARLARLARGVLDRRWRDDG
ncbi:MAG: flippase [Anaerolineae bacterium]